MWNFCHVLHIYSANNWVASETTRIRQNDAVVNEAPENDVHDGGWDVSLLQ